MRTIAQREGALALYQGLVPNFIGASAAWGSYFFLYNVCKKRYGETSEHGLSHGQHLLCGLQAGGLTAAFTNPIWVVKTRMQLQLNSDPRSYKCMSDAFRQIWNQEGMRGLYKGLGASMFGVSHGAIQFMVYEEIRKRMLERAESHKLTSIHWICAGGLSKVVAAISTYPYQVIRSRVQIRPDDSRRSPYHGVRDVVAKTWKHEGLAGFYRGLWINVMRVAPASAITFMVYEQVRGIILKDVV
eukprot:TRINITY_DN257_c0_g3_i1.p1 TRINITY_DN257_c0_g3~~TRINITY_DN257_c0_g3_i1.p1  ORF type:complete len:243 (-),score=37.57 TRINITY_DN257_c0_g3_i1:77-805(-)